jgi:hypothetical protein
MEVCPIITSYEIFIVVNDVVSDEKIFFTPFFISKADFLRRK